MKPTIIDNINFNPDLKAVAKKLKIKPGSARESEIKQLIDEANTIANPKAIYRIVPVEVISEDLVHLDRKPFTSRILCVNLGEVHRAFPYVVTSGMELHEWKNAITDPYTGFLADTVTSFALLEARNFLMSHLSEQYGLRKTGTMNPGSLEDWPIQAQVPLFELLGDSKAAIGVYLTESLLMVPRQSVSGILFETERDYVNCQLCPRENCPNRRAPQDLEMISRYLG